MILLSARNVWLGLPRDDGKCSSLKWTINRFLLHRHPGSESWGGGDPSESPRRFPCSFPRSGWSRIEADVLRTWSPPDSLSVPSPTGKICFLHFSALGLTSHWVSKHRFLMRPSFPAPHRLRPKYHLSKFSPHTMQIRRIFQVTLSHQSGGALKGDTQPNGITRPSNGTPNQLSKGVLRSDNRSWMFRSIPWNPPTSVPPDLIATIPQMSLPWFCALLSQQYH